MVGRRRRWRAAAQSILVGVFLAAASAEPAAQGQGRQNAPLRPGVAPGEIQQLFDAMVVMRAQETLKLDDEQYPRFLTRLRALQEARRRTEVERTRILQDLRRMVQAADPKLDAQILDRLKSLDDVEMRAAADARKALESLDEVLDPRQRAAFRFLEEQIERQKVELLLRARQANRPAGRL
jgi:hypothetical protein